MRVLYKGPTPLSIVSKLYLSKKPLKKMSQFIIFACTIKFLSALKSKQPA